MSARIVRPRMTEAEADGWQLMLARHPEAAELRARLNEALNAPPPTRQRGEQHPCSKLSDKQRRQIRYLRREEGLGYKRIHARFNHVSLTMIRKACRAGVY